ncbi:class I SAM-dependent methyltransferase [Rhodococcus sp. BP-349]|nr:class I SAM-dependent methyltransferase [Rhodococcus sp. BP-363]MBY6544063.1 class I SAM-dependent methyltransferase [Rhodococcus sp. BP-369]MBY6563293.1 class I SAM-dependent methyltransferase [Rhodococcus sp. BP-370]MBY6577585.1 class I SAM-dependent methyltransferase [Rhodococcus sp. BP-364]MBY6586886.1 class I SAM-dependent methyltransferase [Rhodococcus sp. BP-358]MBY6591223.1 class I SAM-dependent methyltransferase [Rhodococcus sp. BP-362]MBY6595443.1 class I SAM-dependent methyltran
MTFSPLAAVYERAWRPLFRLWMGAGGPTVDEQRAYAVRDLGLVSRDVAVVLDVACGPGNFSRSLAEAMPTATSGTPHGTEPLVIGLDASEPMIARASADTVDDEHVAYLLGDARELPFEDDAVDAVCCYAALYLVPEPYRVLDEMIRVLRPGGRIALMTTVRRGPQPVGSVTAAAASTVGLEMFRRDDITDVLRERGVEHVEQRIHGAAQFVTGRLRRSGQDVPVSAP